LGTLQKRPFFIKGGRTARAVRSPLGLCIRPSADKAFPLLRFSPPIFIFAVGWLPFFYFLREFLLLNIVEEKERTKLNEINQNSSLTNGWISKKISELKNETMLTDSEKTIRRKVQNFVEKGFLQERQNPIYKWDKTLQYRVNLVYIAKKLHEIGYTLDGYKYDISELVSEEDNEDAF
jgi:hypothetical protein